MEGLALFNIAINDFTRDWNSLRNVAVSFAQKFAHSSFTNRWRYAHRHLTRVPAFKPVCDLHADNARATEAVVAKDDVFEKGSSIPEKVQSDLWGSTAHSLLTGWRLRSNEFVRGLR